MKRSDRIMAVLMALQRGPVNARELAGKFEVSRRTILRDMESLSEMGVPLYAVSGPGGGYRLMDGFAMPPLQLDAREAMAVLFSLSAIARMSDTPFEEARWTAIDKLRSALPKRTLEHAAPALERVELQVHRRKVRTPLLAELLEHTSQSRWIRVLYRSEKRRRWLELRPEKIYAAHGFWYCVAFSREHGEERTFRADRFESIEVLAGPPIVASGSTIAPPVRSLEEKPVRISAKLTYRGALLVEQDEHIGELVRQVSDDEWHIEFDCPASEQVWALRFFHGLGLDAEVTAPYSLRSELREVASAMERRYRGSE